MRLTVLLPCLLSAALPIATGALRAVDVSVEATATPAGAFSRDQLVATLSRDLSAHFNLEGDLQLELVRTWVPPLRAGSAWTVEILDYPAMPGSSMLVRCRISADRATVEETTLVLRATLWRDAWVARQPLEVGATFDAAQLEARRVDLFRDRDAIPAAVGDHSYIFARAVSTGRLLTWRDLSRRPLVKKGQVVEVSVVDGMLSITMKALAMQSGAQGDIVTIRNPESRKDFSALVIDENRVQVRF